jgi:exodeoxyribonuclease V gamma subunit
MSLELKVSNALESLASDLGRQLNNSAGNVFIPHYIVTQTEGMNIWLKQQLALQLGIVANVDFKKPNDLIFKVYQLLGGIYKTTLSRESLIWFLYELMGQRDFISRYPVQAAYFNVAGPEKDLKRMGLAEKMADIFDQYQIYRPELIKDWNRLTETTRNLDWQAFLWIRAKRLSSVELPDKTFISEFILDKLKDTENTQRLIRTLPAVYLFGLSIITRYHMDVLSEIAKVIDVHFYLLNPAPEIYWIDDKNEKDVAIWRQRGIPDTDTQLIGNNLLTSWGKVLQNTFRLLFKNEQLINSYETMGTIEPDPVSLLQKIQYDIFNNETDGRFPLSTADLSDGSLTIYSNYTIANEVESLYHYLVHLVDHYKANISPRDIVVMVSDVDSYAPYIKAVFDNAPYPFRFKIADVSLTQGDNIYSALQQVLKLNEQNFTSESVMQLLDSAYIRKRFRITDVERLRVLVHEANIRFGMDGRREDETYLVSWTYGLKRMMYGLCLYGGLEYNDGYDLLYPSDLAEGGDAWEVIRFCHFVDVLMASVKSRKRDRSIGEWVRYVEEVVNDLIFLPEDEANEDYVALIEKLSRYNELNELMEESVAYEIFSYNMVSSLEADSRSSLFINDGITFCSLIPMRSIPFKVVAMLGMDNDSFPRREKIVNFNIIHRKHELGDRNIKDNDKHLFLETLLSAKEYLFISYVGKSVSDNTDKPASILVDELIDYIASGVADKTDVRSLMVVQQPLHPFSRRYNSGDDRLFRYADLHPDERIDVFKKEPATNVHIFDEIRLSDVIAFYKNALKSFYNKTLGIYYGTGDVLLSETELFELGALESWSLKNNMLHLVGDEELAGFRNELVRKGTLPLKNIGAAVSLKMFGEIKPVSDLVRQYTRGNREETKMFSMEIDGSMVSGSASRIYDGRLVQLCWSSNTVKYMIEAYINTLVGIASGFIDEVVLINGKNESNVYHGNIAEIGRDEALQRLVQIVSFYKKGLQQRIPFAEYFYSDLKNLDNLDDIRLKMMLEKKISNNLYPFDDPYILKEYANGLFDQPGIARDFIDAANLVIAPVTRMFDQFDFYKS